jgi:outer membrane protein assembly factor BamB
MKWIAARRASSVLAATALVGVLAGCDWQNAGFGPERTNFNPETAISAANAKNLTPLWSVPVNSSTHGILEGSGKLLVSVPSSSTSLGFVQALSATTGQTVWSSSLIGGENYAISGDVVFGGGPGYSEEISRALNLSDGTQRWQGGGSPGRGFPFVAGGLLYTEIPVRDGTISVEADDASNGQFKWGASFGPSPSPPPTVSKGTLYIVSIDQSTGGNGLFLWALNSATGAIRWHVPLSHCPAATPAVVSEGKVYADGETLDAATGRHLWNWPVCPVGGSEALAVSRTSAFVPYATTSGSRLAAFDASTGRLLWSAEWPSDKGRPATPVINNDVVFYSAGSVIVALDAATGNGLWESTPAFYGSYGDPIVANGIVYAATGTQVSAFHLAAGS